VIDPQAIHSARKFMRNTLSQALKADFIAAMKPTDAGQVQCRCKIRRKRGLKNLCLS